MKLPRDLTGDELANALLALGYKQTRQTGSHLRLTTEQKGQHHITVPRHNPLKLGTLSAILSDVVAHFGVSRDALATQLLSERMFSGADGSALVGPTAH